MKKLLHIISAVLFALLPLIGNTAKAEQTEYMRVLSSDAYVYADYDLTEKLFAIPSSYYVKIESTNSTAARVTYGDGLGCPVIMGYMDLSDLTMPIVSPEKPYSVIKVSTDKSDILFNDLDLERPYFNVPSGEIMHYYGEIKTADKTLCYVYYNKKLGYVDKACLNPFTISPNQDPIAEPEPPPEEEAPTNGENITEVNAALGENLQVLIIVGISIVCISVVYFLFKPSKNKVSEETKEFYDD